MFKMSAADLAEFRETVRWAGSKCGWAALILLTLALMLIVGGVAFGEDLQLGPAETFTTKEPVVITHSPQAQVTVSKVGSSDNVPENRVIRLSDRLIVAADPGTYVVQAGAQFGIFQVADLQTATPGEDGKVATKPEETQLAAIPEEAKTPEDSKEKRIVWVYTRRTGCKPCDVFKLEHQPKIEAEDITVIPIYDHNLATPTFILSRPGSEPVQRQGLWPNWTDSRGILAYMEGPSA